MAFTESGAPGLIDPRATGRAGFASGDRVLVDGRSATFCYQSSAEAAVVRYEGDKATRVVPTHKLTRPQLG